MKSIVIYFSQTGNTEKIARAIQSGIKQTAGQCDIIQLKDISPRRLKDYDLIGLGSACWGREPGNVSDFINDMRFVGGKHVFAFITTGGNPEPYFPSIYPKLKSKGLTVIGMGQWFGDCYLLHHMEPYPTKGHPDAVDLKEAEEFGKGMVNISRRISAGETQLIPPEPREPAQAPMPGGPPGGGPGGPGGGPPPGGPQVSPKEIIESFPTMAKYHPEKCKYPKCSLCIDNCPVDGIDFSVNPPVFAKPCLACEFCARICPTGAIDMGDWVKAVADATGKLMPMLLLPALDKAEAEGRFRRFLPKKDINPEVFGYMNHQKHPQWIIGKGAQ
jgi:flavodoxin/NAD-dependent dihydropyrimidine dehydrogenase PreA subunit